METLLAEEAGTEARDMSIFPQREWPQVDAITRFAEFLTSMGVPKVSQLRVVN